MKKLHTEIMISLRNEEGNGFLKKELLHINVTGHNGVSIIGTLKVLNGNFITQFRRIEQNLPPALSFALNSANVLFITGVGNDGIKFDYIKLIEKTQPELTENILLLYKNYKKNIA